MIWFSFFNLFKKLIEKPKMKAGIDISKWNGSIDFPTLKKDPGVDFVIIRATNGLSKIDNYFYQNATGCIDNHIPWGAYHFADMSKPPIIQANIFIETVKKAGLPSMPLVLDVETNKNSIPLSSYGLEKFCAAFLEEIEKNGFDTAIYMSAGFSWFLPKGHGLIKHKLWVADYTPPINSINGWKKVWLHQHSDRGSSLGVKTNVDLNRIID